MVEQTLCTSEMITPWPATGRGLLVTRV